MSSAPQNTALLTLWPLLVACAIAVLGNGRSAVPETCLPRQLVATGHLGGVTDRVQLGARLRGIAVDVAGRLRDARARRSAAISLAGYVLWSISVVSTRRRVVFTRPLRVCVRTVKVTSLAMLAIMLVVLAALNAIFTTWATVTDARRASALMRALGARARQVSSGLVVTQVLSALPGAIAGIPLGILLFRAAVKGGSLPPAPWLAGTVLGTLLVMAGLTLVPARIGARQPVAEVLQSEAA
jgi:hypothetical protein